MLVLTRKPGEAIVIGDDVEIEIVAIGGGKVRVGITAPRSTTVHRKEVYVELQAQEAADGGNAGPAENEKPAA